MFYFYHKEFQVQNYNVRIIYTIMKLMDHVDISQTIRYAKLSSSSGRDAVFNLKLI